jgi:hypothetical protein
MSDQELLAIVIMVIAGCATVTRLGMAWIDRGARSAAGRWAVTAPEVESRLVRIEHAVDSIAVEVERAAENQRFATRLLRERSPIDAGAARAREITHAR